MQYVIWLQCLSFCLSVCLSVISHAPWHHKLLWAWATPCQPPDVKLLLARASGCKAFQWLASSQTVHFITYPINYTTQSMTQWSIVTKQKYHNRSKVANFQDMWNETRWRSFLVASTSPAIWTRQSITNNICWYIFLYQLVSYVHDSAETKHYGIWDRGNVTFFFSHLLSPNVGLNQK